MKCNEQHIDDIEDTTLVRRIFVNFSQSVAKLWNKWRTGSRMTKVGLENWCDVSLELLEKE